MKGSYRVGGVGPVGDVVEHFQTAPGPAGWRWVGARDDGDAIDLTVEASGRVLRLVADHDGWQVRGGSAGDEVEWRRGEDSHVATAAGFTGTSPSYDVAVAQLLQLPVGGSRRLALVEVTEPVGAALLVEHAWARTPAQEQGAERYEVADLATGDRWVVHLVDGVLVAREGARPAVLLGLQL